MPAFSLAAAGKGTAAYLVGIKGTGLSSLAELLADRGVKVNGSDTGERFYTDEILKRRGIEYFETFDPARIPKDVDIVIHSAAYPRESHPELLRASELGIPILTYPEALGELSDGCEATGISGVHGKSTTTAITGTLAMELQLPASVVAGTAVPSFGDRSTVALGREHFIAETCEYRRHFLSFNPNRIVLTNIELEHTDYFSSYEDIETAFLSFIDRLPTRGELIYCADDPGAQAAAEKAEKRHPDLEIIPYGIKADGRFKVTHIDQLPGKTAFRLAGFPAEFTLFVPGVHNVLNSAASIAVVYQIAAMTRGTFGVEDADECAAGLRKYLGSRRRSQIVGEYDGVLYIDDYGHHPTEIRKTLAGYRDFYAGRRIIVDFMPHLYSRTADLFNDFITAFDDADIVILHDVYSSAREVAGEVTGKDLHEAVRGHRSEAHYFEHVMDAFGFVSKLLRPGDVFVTMGAGDNWKLGVELAKNGAGGNGRGST